MTKCEKECDKCGKKSMEKFFVDFPIEIKNNIDVFIYEKD